MDIPLSQTWLATTTPGFEEILKEELDALGARKVVQQAGGVEFDATNKKAYHIITHLRNATRLYLRVDNFRTRDITELYNKVRRIDWSKYLNERQELEIFPYSQRSPLYHTTRLSITVARAIHDSFLASHQEEHLPIIEVLERNQPIFPPTPRRPRPPRPHVQRLIVRICEDRCTLNLDASGVPLYQRSWRKNHGCAPIRESLASCMLRAVNWTPDQYLIDPMCGSGTIPIEAWTMTHQLAPGFFRPFGIEKWSNFNRDSWPTRDELFFEGGEGDPTPLLENEKIRGMDLNPTAISIAKENLCYVTESILSARSPDPNNPTPPPPDSDLPERLQRRAHAILSKLKKGQLCFSNQDVTALKRPDVERGVILTNAPYGVRLRDIDPRLKPATVIRNLIDVFYESFEGWRLGLLLHRDYTPPSPPSDTSVIADFRNGGIPVRLWLIEHSP